MEVINLNGHMDRRNVSIFILWWKIVHFKGGSNSESDRDGKERAQYNKVIEMGRKEKRINKMIEMGSKEQAIVIYKTDRSGKKRENYIYFSHILIKKCTSIDAHSTIFDQHLQ